MSIPAFTTPEALGAPALAPEIASSVRPTAAWRRLVTHRSAVVGLAVMAVYAVAAIFGPMVFPFNPGQSHLIDVFLPPGQQGHLLGTDNLGRDEILMLVYGSRYTLGLGLMAVALGLVVGVPLGAISGYFGGWVDIVIQRLTDILLAFPPIVLALGLIAGLGVGLGNVVIAVGLSSVPSFIRLVRADSLRLREMPFVEAAVALGVSPWLVLVRHVIPNALAPVIVQATLSMGFAILLAASLGFFGLGVQFPTPEWGQMLGEARNYIFSDANLATIPGLAIFAAVLAFNLVGDGLRDALDPRLS
ncbi:MAG TPA: ABC transporter permease [Candidatus Eisenbacteria bacterium]|nr:ABC transporter permease [Candidatus Eisenbacteria bacterium]